MVATERVAPRVAPRAIAGARVLELGGYLAAPFGAQLLGTLGAEVIKIESPHGDESRYLPRDTTFIASNSGKHSIALDLKSSEGREIFANLLRSADVVLHNLSDRATEDLGLRYEDCLAVKPEIVYAQIAAFGEGPYAGRSATNPLIEALVGTTARKGDKPVRAGGAYYDQMAGALVALAIVTALASDSLSPEIRNIRVGLFEVGLYLDGPRLLPRSTGLSAEHRASAFVTPSYDTFQAADRWVYVGAASDSLWRKLCRALEMEDALDDPALATREQREARRVEITARLEKTIGAMPSQVVIDRLTAAGVPCVPVHEHDEVFEDAHVRTPGKLTVAAFNGKQVEVGASPVVGAGSIRVETDAAPLLGEHSVEILRELGYDDEACADLLRHGVVVAP